MSVINHALIFCILWQVRSFKGEMNIDGAFSLINEKEEDKYTIWELVYELWINYVFYKENAQFRELTSFYWVQWLVLGWNSISNGLVNEIWEVGRIFDSETILIRPSYCSLYYFEPRYIFLGLKLLLLTQLRMYQMYL